MGLDADDLDKREYESTRALVVWYSGRLGVPKIMNDLAMTHAQGDILIGLGDRSLFRTQDWDLLLDREIGGKVAMVWPNNGDPRHKCTMWAMTRPYMNAVGCFVDTRFEHFYADNVVGIVGELSGCGHYCHDLLIEQRHVTFGTAPRDKTYQERRDGGINARDAEKFFAMEAEMVETAERVLQCSQS